METLFNKDRITEVNPYLFQKIQNKINDKNVYVVPSWSLNVLKLSIIGVVLLIGFNIFSSFNPESNQPMQNISENNSYNEFVKDNHFDALSSLYPVELLKEE